MSYGRASVDPGAYRRFGEKGPSPRRKRGKWDEASVERDLPFIEEAIRIMDTAQTAIQLDKSDAVKTGLRLELEQAGWQYNSRATFKANLPFRSKYLVFNSSYKQDIKNSYRIKLATGHGIVSDYKLMKWVPKITPDYDIAGTLIDLIATKKGRIILAICIICAILANILCRSL